MLLNLWCILTAMSVVVGDNIPSYEIEALYDFYESTNGTHWKYSWADDFDGVWNFTDPQPCTDAWAGIWCNLDFTHITEIQLTGISLMGTLPPSLGNLSELTQLVLRENLYLVGSLPVELVKLTKLEILSLNQNGFNATIPAFLGDMSALGSIDLEVCKFHGTIPPELGKLQNLQWLQLSSNYLTGTVPPELGDLAELKQLTLYGMRGIVGSIPPELCKLSRLSSFVVDGNSMTGTIPNCVGNWTSLTELDIARNYFNGTIPNAIASLPHGQYFYLNTNQFTGTLPEMMWNMTNLIQFNAFKNFLKGSIPSMSNTVKLTMLYLAVNQLTGPIPVGLCNASNLNSLDLSYNQLTQHIPYCLFSHTKLNVAYLMSNRLTGPLPSEYNNITNLNSLQVQDNMLSQQIPPTLFNTSLGVYSLYLQDNHFSGTVPDTISAMTSVVELDLHNNYITGSIPDIDLMLVNLLILDSNLLSGEIPPSLGKMTQLQSLFLFNNLLTGTIPPQLRLIKALTIFALNFNLLTGSLAPELSMLSNLDIFFVYNNILTGSLDGVFDSSIQNIKYIDVSKNQLSGTIPVDVFRIRDLISFTAVSNCFTGSIPNQICECHNLTTLALDGLMSASNCQMRFFPAWTSSYGLPNAIKGGMPECLFAMPRMLSLHLSGNGLTGTLSNDLIISNSLMDLSLSHNNLKGDIPTQMQLHNWTNLDLSYNKFRGTLDPDIFSVYGDNGTLSLQVNRLSGVIPSSMRKAPHVTILDGNIYECDVSRKDLPEHDSYRNIYECGSNTFNYALYFWLMIAIAVTAVAVLTASLYTNSSSKRLSGASYKIVERLRLWMDVFNTTGRFSGMHEPIPRLNEVLSFGQFVMAFRMQVLKLTALIIVVCLPVYLILSTYYDTYTYEYAWSTSGCYLSGEVPSGIMFLIFCLFFAAAVYCVKCISVVREKQFSLNTSEVVEYVRWTYQEYGTVFLMVLFNLILVTAVNIGYVYVDHNYASGVVRITQISVALFKIVWKNWIVRLLLKFSSREGSEGKGTNLSLPVFVTIFNNIAAPFIATCYVSSDCFYNVVSSPPKVKVSYEYMSCLYGAFTDNVTTCYTFNNIKLTETSYDPPFVYSFQCSSTFVTTYSSVYVLMLTIEAFAVPFVMWLLAWYSSRSAKLGEKSALLSKAETLIPKILQAPKQEDAESKLLPSLKEQPAGLPYFECAVFVVKLVNIFSILCTFGVVLPPIAVVCCVAVFNSSYNIQLLLGRLLTNVAHSSVVMLLVDADCRHSFQMFLGSLWTLIPFVCIFYSIILFDTLGDSVGWRKALWAPLLLLVLPVVCWCVYQGIKTFFPSLLGCCNKKQQKRRSSGCIDSAGGEFQRHVSASGVVYSQGTDYSPLRLNEDDTAAKALIPCEDSAVMNTNL